MFVLCFAVLNKLAGSSVIDELNVKCGVCKEKRVIVGDRAVSGETLPGEDVDDGHTVPHTLTTRQGKQIKAMVRLDL